MQQTPTSPAGLPGGHTPCSQILLAECELICHCFPPVGCVSYCVHRVAAQQLSKLSRMLQTRAFQIVYFTASLRGEG